MPYLKQSSRKELFVAYLERLNEVGTNWSAYEKHGDVIRRFAEIGGFASCPNPPATEILKWMVLTYIGTSGGQTRYGNVRNVFYSNTAAPLLKEIFIQEAELVREKLKEVAETKEVKRRLTDQHIARRFEKLLDFLEE